MPIPYEIDALVNDDRVLDGERLFKNVTAQSLRDLAGYAARLELALQPFADAAAAGLIAHTLVSTVENDLRAGGATTLEFPAADIALGITFKRLNWKNFQDALSIMTEE